MFRKKTLFILGAGSSHEVGLPVGNSLKELISENIDIRFENGHKQISGDYRITNALRKVASQNDGGYGDINPFLKKSWMLREALPLSISIDNLLDAHRDDREAETCGKLGIITSILNAERNSKLFSSTVTNNEINIKSLEDSWFTVLTKLLTEGVSRDDIDTIFENIAFINFNYDRCLETYLYYALKKYYNLAENEVVSLINDLIVIRPYGSVGKLPWQSGDYPVVSYGSDKQDLTPLVDQIKTFNEKVHDPASMETMHKLIKSSENIIFLGFAYHRQNLELLKIDGNSHISNQLGTAFGLSGSECGLLNNELKNVFGTNSHVPIKLEMELTCKLLLEQYSRFLTS